MICPHCEYKNGWHWIEDDNLKDQYVECKGEKGEFYELKLELERQRYREWEAPSLQRVSLYGCPVCMKAFIE